MSLTYSFLVLEEHPYGREMLRVLLENDLVPKMIIQEVSAVGDEERSKFLDRIAGQPQISNVRKCAGGFFQCLEKSLPTLGMFQNYFCFSAARTRRRKALSLMKPVASVWS